MKRKFEVTYNLGFVSYEVEAETKEEAERKALKKRLDDGYISPTSELAEIKELKDE